MLRKCDKLIVLGKNGQVIEEGTHKHLSNDSDLAARMIQRC